MREDADISLARIAPMRTKYCKPCRPRKPRKDTFCNLIVKKRPVRAKSPIEAKIHELPKRTKFSQANTHLNNRGPRQHLRGARRENAIRRRGIPRPSKNSFYALY